MARASSHRVPPRRLESEDSRTPRPGSWRRGSGRVSRADAAAGARSPGEAEESPRPAGSFFRRLPPASSPCAWFLALAGLSLVPVLPVLPRLETWFFGFAGQGRGEFENWFWLHWWIRRLLEFHARDAGDLLDFLVRVVGLARDLDLGNMADTLFLSFPLQALLGEPVSHNLKILLILVGNALAAGVLARALGARSQALYVTAAGLALSPFVWIQIQECRMAQAILAFVFLGAAAWLKLLERPTARGGLWFGLLLGLALVFYWYYGLWLGMWCLLTLVPSRRLLPGLAVAAVMATSVSLPFLTPYLQGEGSKSPVPYGQPFPALQDLERYPPGQLGPIGPSLVLSQSLSPGWPLDPCQPYGFSLVWLALAVLGAPKASRRWLLPATVFWLLTLGPYLRWGEDFLDLELPYAWLYRWVPAWSRLFWPWRMAPFVFMSLAPLVLAGLRRFHRPALVFTGLLLAELALRGTLFLSAAPVAAAPFYQIPGPREGIVELSYPWNSSLACYWQAFHGRPTLGTVSQAWPHYGPPPESLLADPRRYREEPFLAWLEQVREGPAGPAPPADFLVRWGYRWVVVHTDRPGGLELVRRVRAGLGPWHHRDAQVVAWKLSLGREGGAGSGRSFGPDAERFDGSAAP